MGNTNWGNEELAFLESAIKEGRSQRRLLQMLLQNIKWPKTIFLNLVSLLLHCLFPKEHHSFLSRWFLLSFSSRLIYLSFSLKEMSGSTPLNCLLSNPLHPHGLQIRNNTEVVYACTCILCGKQARGKHIFKHQPFFFFILSMKSFNSILIFLSWDLASRINSCCNQSEMQFT